MKPRLFARSEILPANGRGGRARLLLGTSRNSPGARRLERPPPQRGAMVRRQVPVSWPVSRWTRHPIRFLAGATAVARVLVVLGLIALSVVPAHAASTNVAFGSFFFNPSVVTINTGDTVFWTNGLAGSHTLLGTGSDPICGGAFLPCSHTFNVPGTYTYQCTLLGHAAAGMTGAVVVVGMTISPPVLTNAMRLPNGDFQFTVSSTANRTNIIQASTNLTLSNWIPIGTTVPATNVFTFTDTNAAAFPIRFYRVAQPQ